jgi:MFS family permease
MEKTIAGTGDMQKSTSANHPPKRADEYGPRDQKYTLALPETAPTTVDDDEPSELPPDGGYGWVCTACVFLINANTWGVNSAWAIFLARYLSDSTFPGATQLEYALIGGLSISQSLVAAPLVALSTRTLGTRPCLFIGAILVACAWLGASFATQIWHLFLSVGVCFGFGMGFLYIPATAVLPQWFLRRRSLAVGLASSGAGLGGLAYNLGAGAAVQSLGLPWTYRVLAICSFSCNVVSALLLKDRNKVVKPLQRSFDYRELRRIETLLIIAWGFLTELGYIVLLYSLPHYAIQIGLSSKQGSIVGAVLNLGLGLFRPLIGYMSDAWGRINVACMMTTLCGIYCLAIWIPAKSFGVLVLFAFLAGTVCGNYWGTVSAVMAECVGLQRLPSTFGVMCVALILPTLFAEPLGLEIVTASGYLASQVFVGFMFLIAAACLFMLRSWKMEKVRLKEEGAVDRVSDNSRIPCWLAPRNMVRRGRV